MIIDMRLRPPYKSITQMSFFKTPQFIVETVEKTEDIYHHPVSLVQWIYYFKKWQKQMLIWV